MKQLLLITAMVIVATFVVFQIKPAHASITNQTGTASFYADRFHGRLTASGERFNMWGKTAAHNSLPFGTKVKVTNVDNGKSVIVKINDRGGFHKYNRIIDLSKGSAQKINCSLCTVKIKVLKMGNNKYHRGN